MSRTENVTLTNMCMIYNGSKVLVQEKINSDYCGITFPGGHVEKGEAFTDAVIREVFEETGLRIFTPKLCGIKDWINDDGSRYMVLLYKTDKFEGKLKSSDEGDVYWLELQKMRNSQLAGGMDKVIDIFLDENMSEYFFYRENGEWVEVLK